ncbi:hypothetical protein [Halosimplex pelagicum]|uniref:Uncharacterized protein n=1 Tax=Halosimplex pelagicum TaxID=869886 RepID=A0A7D5TST4_9EURY|nr:hypothetical protein [Halosimplex pelagicum]QLH82212.1 hypothetical protein HZS54_11600 [Halosimplex pelagicum]
MIESQPYSSASTGLHPFDPWDQYEFSIEIDAEGYKETHEMRNLLFASRTYTDVEDIDAVYPFNFDLATVIDRVLNMRVVDPETGEQLDDDGVEITVVFKSGPAGRYTPIDVLISGSSIDDFDVDGGFWRIDSRLAQLIKTQTPGLTHEQVAYEGQERNAFHHPAVDIASE